MTQLQYRPSRLELFVAVLVLIALATIPLWTLGWWTALPFATGVGGLMGGRWLRWYWAPVIGFATGALAWGLELALLPADPRTRLAEVLGAAQGVSGPVFLLLGPLLFGLVAVFTATALAGALRLVDEPHARSEPFPPVTAGAAPPAPPP